MENLTRRKNLNPLLERLSYKWDVYQIFLERKLTSKHTFDENTNSLAELNYAPLLDRILKLVQEDNLFKFSTDKRKLRVSPYEIAHKIATNKELQPQSPLTKKHNIKAATVNFSSDTEFYSRIKAIRDELKKTT